MSGKVSWRASPTMTCSTSPRRLSKTPNCRPVSRDNSVRWRASSGETSSRCCTRLRQVASSRLLWLAERPAVFPESSCFTCARVCNPPRFLLHSNLTKRMTNLRSSLSRCRRPVIKIGSAVLAGASGGAGAPSLDRKKFAALCDDLAAAAKGRALTVVSSGAVALGVERLGLAQRPKEMALKQAAAAAGQSRLMRLYDDELDARSLHCAQVLLTHADIEDRGRYLNARRALAELLSRNVVPVINENDTVSVEEIKFGDNDALAAMVVDLVEADLLVILTDAGGLYTADPRKHPEARRIPEVERVTAEVEALAG